MRVVQEPDVLEGPTVRGVGLALLLAVLVCAAGAAGLLLLSAGQVRPRGFVAGRAAQSIHEISAIELGVFGAEEAAPRARASGGARP